MKHDLALYLGKAIFSLTRLLKIGGGSAAPGLYALKIDPDLVEKLVAKIPRNIIITGTNGKTTTARMLAHFAKTSNFRVIRNSTGSNLERGIASALISSSGKFDLGIWELDEAAFNSVAPKIKPDMIVFLNVFRDQLDRYGEVDSVVEKWGETLSKLDVQTQILVNGDDNNTLQLANSFKGRIQRFGVENYKIAGESTDKQKYSKKLDFEAKNIKLNGLSNSSFELKIENLKLKIVLPLPGIYHIYDFLAAFAISRNLGLDQKKMISALASFSPAFGRVEKLPFGYILLIKNPVGATQVFQTIAPQFKKGDRLLLALNDNLADGTDVSWIWDAEFESLQSTAGSLQIICSGTRAYDLAVRLKYAGVDPKYISTVVDLKKAFKKARTGLSGQLFILPTYTALLHLQSVLAKLGIIKRYWEKS